MDVSVKPKAHKLSGRDERATKRSLSKASLSSSDNSAKKRRRKSSRVVPGELPSLSRSSERALSWMNLYRRRLQSSTFLTPSSKRFASIALSILLPSSRRLFLLFGH